MLTCRKVGCSSCSGRAGDNLPLFIQIQNVAQDFSKCEMMIIYTV
jgi:hypothetical protein